MQIAFASEMNTPAIGQVYDINTTVPLPVPTDFDQGSKIPEEIK